MALHINSLPDLCLRKIFWRVPVRTLLRLGRVCTKWLWLQRSVCLRVRCLTLVIGGTVSEDYPKFTVRMASQADRILKEDGRAIFPRRDYPTWHSVHFKWLDLNALIGLTVILPNVSSLEIAFHMGSIFQLSVVTLLVVLWHTNLVTFRLCAVFDDALAEYYIPSQITGQLIETVNSLSRLKQLSLMFPNTSFDPNQIDLSILGQLDRFDFLSTNTTDLLLDSFRAYAVHNPRLRLQYEYFTSWDSRHLEHYYRLGTQFCSQFENILYLDLSLLTQLERFCTQFRSITTLDLNVSVLTIHDVFINLSRLSQLVHLGLIVSFETEEAVEVNDEDQPPLAQLPSVKSFELFASCFVSHNNLTLLAIPRTMPNLQIVHLSICVSRIGHRCDLCGFAGRDDELDVFLDVTAEQLNNCFSHVMLPLAECPRLHTISFEMDCEEFDENVILKNLTREDISRPLDLV